MLKIKNRPNKANIWQCALRWNQGVESCSPANCKLLPVSITKLPFIYKAMMGSTRWPSKTAGQTLIAVTKIYMRPVPACRVLRICPGRVRTDDETVKIAWLELLQPHFRCVTLIILPGSIKKHIIRVLHCTDLPQWVLPQPCLGPVLVWPHRSRCQCLR